MNKLCNTLTHTHTHTHTHTPTHTNPGTHTCQTMLCLSLLLHVCLGSPHIILAKAKQKGSERFQ